MLGAVWGCHLLHDNKKLITDNHLQPAGGWKLLYVVFAWTIEFAASRRGFSISPPSVAQVLVRATFYLDCFPKTKWDGWVIYQKSYEGGCFVCRFVTSALLVKLLIFRFQSALILTKVASKETQEKIAKNQWALKRFSFCLFSLEKTGD